MERACDAERLPCHAAQTIWGADWSLLSLLSAACLQSEVEETLERIKAHKGVEGVIIGMRQAQQGRGASGAADDDAAHGRSVAHSSCCALLPHGEFFLANELTVTVRCRSLSSQ